MNDSCCLGWGKFIINFFNNRKKWWSNENFPRFFFQENEKKTTARPLFWQRVGGVPWRSRKKNGGEGKKKGKKIYIQLIRAYRHITKQGHCPGHTPGRLPNKVNGSFIKWPPLDRAPISSGCWSGEISLGFDRFDLLFPFGESWRGLLQQPTKPSSSFKSDRLLFVVRAVKFPFIGNLQALIA